ncbi:MAG: gliding motility-associated C-terminal domain-containing protein [Bacteroidetes bacterium]|nr:gliding motility-associated C-terminal domain-containing protein [Bacteroidota bacterium]
MFVQGGGHIVSENQYNFIKWNSGTGTGNYVFPFGVGAVPADYIPYTFNKTTGGNSDVTVSTWATNAQNVTHPGTSNVGAVTSMTGVTDSVTSAIDRFWDIRGSAAVTADLTFSYRGSENTTTTPTDTFKAQHWNGSSWDTQAGPGNPGVTSGIGTVGPVPGQTTFSPWVLTKAALNANITTSTNLLCNSQCTGSATVTAQGGTSPYTYAWSGGGTNSNEISLCAGTFTVTVTDGAGTTSTASVIITEPSPVTPTITAGGPTTFCAGGSVTLTSSAASSYSWSTLEITQGITVSSGGTYTVTVTDGSGCTGTANQAVTVNSNPTPTITPGGPTTFCAGGSVTLTSSAASSYSWTTLETTQGIIVSSGGTYTVTVTDGNGCTGTASQAVTVNSNPVPTITPGGPTTFCAGGSVMLTSSAASSYSWSTLETTQGIIVSSGGTYTVTVTDGNGCTGTTSQAVTVNSNPIPTITAGGPTTFCAGGSVTLTSSAASSYSWSTLETTQGITASTGGTYTVTVTDGNGCTGTANQAVTVNSNPTPTITAGGPTTFCAGGSVTLTSSAASSYSWSTLETTQAITVSASGTYTITVTDPNGCTGTDSEMITESPAIITSLNNAICSGDSIYLQGTWQTSAGTYYDTLLAGNGCDSVIQTTLAVNSNYTTPVATGICQGDSIFLQNAWQTSAGTYYDTVLTINGCDSAIITTLAVDAFIFNPVSASICPGDSIQLPDNSWTGTGGVYYDTLTAAAGCDSIIQTTLTVNPTYNTPVSTAICSGDSILVGGSWQSAGGTYYDTLGTVNGCDSVIVTTLTVNPTYNTAATAAICAGDSILLSGSWQSVGGIYYDTLISAGGCDSVITTTLTVYPTYNTPAGATICSGDSIFLGGSWQFAAGSYYDTLASINGCDSVIITTLSLNPSYIIPTTAAICTGDSIFLNGSWQTSSGTYYDSLVSINGCDSVIETTLSVVSFLFTAVSASMCPGDSIFLSGSWQTAGGAYYDTLTAVAGCDSIIQTTLTVNSTYLTPVTAAICTGDSILLGGSWQSAGGTYYDSLVSINGCDSVIETTLSVDSFILNPLSVFICQGDSFQLPGGAWVNTGGVYNDTLTAVAGCDSIIQTTLTVNPTATATATATICSGDSIFLSGSWQLAAGIYNDTLSTVNGCDSIIQTTLTVNPTAAATATATICSGDSIFVGGTWQTSAGTYYDTLTAANGCDSVIQTTLTVNPTATATATAGICTGDSIYLQGAWQTTSGTYYDTLIAANGCDSIIQTTLTVNPIFTTPVPAAICYGDSLFLQGVWQTTSGIYYDTMQTVNSCDSIIVTILSVDSAIFIPVSAVICQGDSVQLPGGNWVSSAGVYYDTLASVTGCDSIVETTLSVLPVSSIQYPASICTGDSIFLQGAWQTTSGSYYDTLVAANGCDSIITTVLTVSPAIITSFNTTDASCIGCSDGAIDLTVNGGTPPYTFLWSNSSITEDIANLVAGTYTVTVSDSIGCSVIDTAIITEPPCNLQIALAATNITCNGFSNGAIDLTVISGTPPFTYLWSNGMTTEDISGLPPGTYSVNVTDSNGCGDGDTVVISEPPPLVLTVTTSDSIICNGESVIITASVTPSGYTVNYTWNTGSTTSSITITPAQSYDYSVSVFIAECNLTINDSVGITVNQLPQITIPVDTIEINRTETAQLSVSGGITYSWSPTESLDNPASSAPLASPDETTEYFVSGTDSNGCSGNDSVLVIVNSEESAFVPNIFSPNGDGKNDLVGVMGRNIKTFKFTIYDRWGEKLFESTVLGNNWNGYFRGKKLTPQVLVYYADVEFYSGDFRFLSGTITIVE